MNWPDVACPGGAVPGRSPCCRPTSPSAASPDRAVSPVVGVVLLAGLTIVLALLAAPLVFDFARDTGESTPEAEFGFGYTEATDPVVRDSFGTPGGGPGGEGLLTVIYQNGDPLPPGQVHVETTKSGGPLTDAAAYGSDNSVESGDRITVWVGRGESIEVVWESADGERSATLGDFSVETVATLPPGVPSPDVGCEYVEDRTPGDLTIAGTVVECNLDEYDVGDVTITDGGAVIGEVAGSGSVTVGDGEVHFGSVRAGVGGGSGGVTITGDSEIDGDVRAAGGGPVTIEGEADVDGTVRTNGSVELREDAAVQGSIDTSGGAGDVSVSGDASVDHDIRAGGRVDLSGTATVGGDIEAAGPIAVDGETADGSLDGATVDGSLDGADTVTLSSGAVGGDVTAGAAVSLTDSTVGGDLSAGGDVSCTDSTINGQSCTAYLSPTFAVTIDGTSTPAAAGSTVTVDAVVNNTGFAGDREIALDIDGTTVDSRTVSLDSGEQTTESLSWPTGTGDVGEYTATVRSEQRQDQTTIALFESGAAYFDVTVESANESVVEGRDLVATVTVENAGSQADTQDVTLTDFDGTVVDSADGLTLASGESRAVTLAWNTTDGDAGMGNVTIASANRTRTPSAAVEVPVYTIEDVLVSDGATDDEIALFVTVDTNDDGADMVIESVQRPDSVVDSTTVPAVTGEYTVGGGTTAEEVRVRLRDRDGVERDSETEPWGG